MFFVCLCKLSPQYENLLNEGKEIELVPQRRRDIVRRLDKHGGLAQKKNWAESPLYKEMNRAMLHAVGNGIEYTAGNDNADSNKDNLSSEKTHGFVAKNLPVGFRPGGNTIYVNSKL